MAVHDWTRVDGAIFHDFHTAWIIHLKESLNAGLLPSEHYALCSPSKQPAQRHIAIRHVSNHCVVALLEIVSPGNKDRAENVDDFVRKARQALDQGCHLLVIDLFPPGRHDPLGMHGAIWKKLGRDKTPPPAGLPLGLAAYLAKSPPEAYLEWVGVGSALPAMPLFLDTSRYIDTPLEETYEAAWHGVPRVWRDVLEKPATIND